MNPEDAYQLQTDWARAVNTPDSPQAQWMQRKIETLCVKGFRSLTEPQTFDRILVLGPEVDASIVVGRTPVEVDDDIPTDVFEVPTEEQLVEETWVKAKAVLVPEEIYGPTTIENLGSASTYYVTADMCTVMEVAAEAFDQFDLMPRMPAYAGFVVLARPIHLPMPDGKTQPVRAFAWNTWGSISTTLSTQGQIGEIWTFASRNKDGDFDLVEQARAWWSSKKAWQNDADLLPCYTDWLITGTQLPPVAEPVAEIDAKERAHQWFREHIGDPQRREDGSIILPSRESWEASVTAGRAKYDQFLAEATEKQRTDQYGYFQPYLAAFVLLLTQQITVAEKKPVAEAYVRRGSKASGRHRASTVTVVDIRNSERPDTDTHGTGRRGALTNRHLVGSHWKWQPYGTKRALRRRIFLAGYVRGPADAPLVVKPRVTRI